MSRNKEHAMMDIIAKANDKPMDFSVAHELNYGVTTKYDRKNYDSQAAHKEFHDSQFQGKKTVVGSDGEILHREHKAAERKYGKVKAPQHQAEADHRDPLKNIHRRATDNPILSALLTDEDIKEIGNRPRNYQELSKHENTSKGEQSEFQRGLETKNFKRAAKGLYTQTETDVLLTGRAVKNAANAVGAFTVATTSAAVESGKETALITLTVSGINNLVAVASGQKELETALKDVASDATSSFVNGASVRLAQETIVGIFRIAGADQAANFISNGFPSAEIAMVVMTTNTVRRYLDGEISGEDCAIQLIANAAGTLAYQLGGAIGGPAGAIISSIIVTQVTNTILEYRQEKKIQREKAAEIDLVLSHAMMEIAYQKEKLLAYAETDLKYWDDTIAIGFDTILRSVTSQDTAGITQGINVILELFNSHVIYPTLAEFDKDFYNLDALPLVL